MAGGKDTGGKKEYDRFYVASLARECTDKAIKKLMDVMESGDNADATRAAAILLDRGWGKAPQEIKLGNADEDKGLKLLVEVVDPKKSPIPDAAAERSQSQELRAADQDTTGADNPPA